MNLNLAEEIQKICRLWPSKYGLITCLIVEVVFLALISPHIDGFNKTTFFHIPGFIFGCLIIWLSTIFYWLYSNRLPKTEKGKFGFVVSIYCDDYETDKKFRADFIKNLNVLITDGLTGKYFNFIELSNHAAKDISNTQDAQSVLEKTKAHFIIHGRVKTRDKIHYFELNSIVTHKPLPIVVSNELKKEMSELLPRKIKIEDNNFLESFEFTSKWAEIASKYLIGNARLLSGDIGPALELYNEVLNASKNYENVPVINELQSKSIKNIVVILDIRATGLYEKWVETHDMSLIEDILPLLDEYGKYNICNYQIETIKSIIFVLLYQDIDSAIKILSVFTKGAQNATWMFNKAFLFAYKGDINTAYREYSHASKRPMNEFYDGLINKVEDFILLMIEQNPKVPQLYYCLGIINKDFKEDFLLAKRDFETFISLSPINIFTKEKEIANRWVNEMTNKVT